MTEITYSFPHDPEKVWIWIPGPLVFKEGTIKWNSGEFMAFEQHGKELVPGGKYRLRGEREIFVEEFVILDGIFCHMDRRMLFSCDMRHQGRWI